MTFKDYNHSSKPLFYELNLLNVYQLNYFGTGNLMNQYSKKQLQAALMLLFKTNEEIHNYNTRSIKKLHKATSKTNIRKFAICNKGVDIYNSLPYIWFLKENQCSFKRKFKNCKSKENIQYILIYVSKSGSISLSGSSMRIQVILSLKSDTCE